MEEFIWHNLLTYACSDDVIEGLFTIPSQSAWFEGHFPGNPVLPGISMLGMVQDLFIKHDPYKKIIGFKRIRFRQVLHDDVSVNITITTSKDGTDNMYSFDILNNGNLICSGIFETIIRQDA